MKIGDYEDENFPSRPNLSGAIQLNKILVFLSGFLIVMCANNFL